MFWIREMPWLLSVVCIAGCCHWWPWKAMAHSLHQRAPVGNRCKVVQETTLSFYGPMKNMPNGLSPCNILLQRWRARIMQPYRVINYSVIWRKPTWWTVMPLCLISPTQEVYSVVSQTNTEHSVLQCLAVVSGRYILKLVHFLLPEDFCLQF